MIKTLIVLLAFMVSGCHQCEHFSKVKDLGQCTAGSFVSDPECAAMTEDGHKIKRSEPMVVGENVCTE